MAVADVMALRSPCTRAQVGAVIVDPNDRIVATGYNGAPAGFRVRGLFADEPRARRLSVGSCTEWCPHSTTANPSPCYDDCFSIHAEANALMFCDRRERLALRHNEPVLDVRQAGGELRARSRVDAAWTGVPQA
jgi:dCMP deaminase